MGHSECSNIHNSLISIWRTKMHSLYTDIGVNILILSNRPRIMTFTSDVCWWAVVSRPLDSNWRSVWILPSSRHHLKWAFMTWILNCSDYHSFQSFLSRETNRAYNDLHVFARKVFWGTRRLTVWSLAWCADRKSLYHWTTYQASLETASSKECPIKYFQSLPFCETTNLQLLGLSLLSEVDWYTIFSIILSMRGFEIISFDILLPIHSFKTSRQMTLFQHRNIHLEGIHSNSW